MGLLGLKCNSTQWTVSLSFIFQRGVVRRERVVQYSKFVPAFLCQAVQKFAKNFGKLHGFKIKGMSAMMQPKNRFESKTVHSNPAGVQPKDRFWLCFSFAFSLLLLCFCFAFALLLLCFCFASALLLLCFCFASALLLLCFTLLCFALICYAMLCFALHSEKYFASHCFALHCFATLCFALPFSMFWVAIRLSGASRSVSREVFEKLKFGNFSQWKMMSAVFESARESRRCWLDIEYCWGSKSPSKIQEVTLMRPIHGNL